MHKRMYMYIYIYIQLLIYAGQAAVSICTFVLVKQVN